MLMTAIVFLFMCCRNVAQQYYVRQLMQQSEESIRDAWARVGPWGWWGTD